MIALLRIVSEDEDDNEAEVVNAQEVPEDFVDLIDVLRSQFGGFATFSKASYLITRRGSKIWGEGNRYLSFNKYVREAYRAGLVESGQMPGQKHNPKAQWVKLLVSHYQHPSIVLLTSLPRGSNLIVPTPRAASQPRLSAIRFPQNSFLS